MSNTPFFESELFAELKEDLTQSSRFTATYRIAAPDYEEARKLAFGICVEQTVECPYELVKGTPIGDTIVGQIEDLKKAEPGAYYATISYDPTAVGNEMAELLNMLFGNTSLQPGIKLMSFDLPEAMYDNYPGPRFGRTGLRDLCGVPRGPILMSAIKPLGRSPKELGQMVYDLAMGGCPIIKDDHSLMNQDYAPFEERVLQCVMALADAKEKGLVPTLMYYEQLFSDYIVADFSDEYVFRWTGLDEEDRQAKEERQKLVDAQNELKDMTERAKALINTVREDEVTWQILWHRYILGESWKEMSARLHYSRTSLYLKLEQGLGLIQERLNTTEHD